MINIFKIEKKKLKKFMKNKLKIKHQILMSYL